MISFQDSLVTQAFAGTMIMSSLAHVNAKLPAPHCKQCSAIPDYLLPAFRGILWWWRLESTNSDMPYLFDIKRMPVLIGDDIDLEAMFCCWSVSYALLLLNVPQARSAFHRPFERLSAPLAEFRLLCLQTVWCC